MKPHHWIALWCSILTLLYISQVVRANSAPPPNRIWFVFADGRLPSAAQLQGCSDTACTQIDLLHEYGRCESADCIDTPKQLQSPTDYFDCADGRCLFTSYAQLPPYLKLAAQFPDGDRSTDPFAATFTDRWAASNTVSVSTENARLRLTPSTRTIALGTLGKALPWLLPSGLLTLLVEVLVSLAILFFVFKAHSATLAGWGAWIAVANLLSYPATWLFFPTLGAFGMSNERLLGSFVMLAVFVLAGLLIGLRHAQRRNIKIALGILLGLLLAVFCAGSFVLLALAGYASYFPSTASGLPSATLLILAELFAVIFETIVIYLLNKRQLALARVAVMSLTANAASFLIGLLVFSPLTLM